MILRAWMVWGALASLAGSVGIQAKPPESPVPLVDGTATPILTQNYFEPEPGPSPRLLGAPAIIPAVVPQPKRGLPLPVALPSDLDAPILISFLTGGNWKAKTAYEIAEMHADASDRSEAARWYKEVIRQAPNSLQAVVAAERLATIERNR